jgi:hypothetical protein
MKRSRGWRSALPWLALWAGSALAQDGGGPAATEQPLTPAAAAAETKPAPPPLAALVSPADSLPKLRYFADGLVTLNDRCPVRKVKLNPRMQAAYVNGFPVGFC